MQLQLHSCSCRAAGKIGLDATDKRDAMARGALRTSAPSGFCSFVGATAAGVCGQRVRAGLSRFGAQTSKGPRKRSIFRLERIIFTPPCMRGALRTSASSGVCSVAGATAAGVCGQRVRVGTVRVGWRKKQQRFLPGERALAREVQGQRLCIALAQT